MLGEITTEFSSSNASPPPVEGCKEVEVGWLEEETWED